MSFKGQRKELICRQKKAWRLPAIEDRNTAGIKATDVSVTEQATLSYQKRTSNGTILTTRSIFRKGN